MTAALWSLVLLLACPSRALFGREDAKITVLWVPSASFSRWTEVDEALQRDPDVRFTLAVAPEDVPPEAAKKLAAWSASGRLELALRLKGDPILPLITDHPDAPRPQDALNRLALEREPFKERFGAPAAAFVPGAGAVSPPLFEAFNAMALSWVGVGDYAGSSGTWTAAGPTVLVPLKAARTFGRDLGPEDISLPDYPRADAFVIDEADGLAPDGAWLRLLAVLAAKRPKQGWQTVGQAAAARKAQGAGDAYGVKDWPTWAGGTAPWTSGAAQGAWKLYGAAARALEHYQNSGVAKVQTLEDAAAELYQAQSSRYFRLLAEGASAEAAQAEREFRGHLLAVYRKTKQTAPESFYLSLLDKPKAGAEGDDEDTGSTDVRFTQGDSWLAFENPAGSLSRAPADAGPLGDGTPAAQLWKIKGLRVEWDGASTTFVYKMAALDNSNGAPAELGPLLLDTYIDINHIVGAGSIDLLPGRPGAVVARDAWEYALTVSGWGAALYRYNALGTPQLSGRLAVAADPRAREVRVSVPSSMIKGNPVRWGYVVAAFAVDPATTAKPPPKPRVDGDSGAVLGLLAPLERQMGLSAEASRPRLVAVRAKAN